MARISRTVGSTRGDPPPATGGRGRRPKAPQLRPEQRSPVARSADATSSLLQRAVEEAARLLEADGALIYLYDPETGGLHYAHDAGIAEEDSRRLVRELRLRIGSGMFGASIEQRRVLATADYLRDTSFAHEPAADRFSARVGIRSMVVAPMIAGDRIFGGLGTFATRPDAFSEAQIALVRSLADHAAAAMANVLLIEQLDQSRLELARRADAERTLREIATRISSLREPGDVIQRTVDEAARLLAADEARIDLIDPATGLLRWAYQSGAERPDDRTPDDPDERLDSGVSGRAVAENRVFFTGDYLSDARFSHNRDADRYIEGLGVRSVMSAPLTGDAGTIGALTVYTSRRDAWDERDAEVLAAVGTQASIAISNARLIEELARSREELAARADAEQTLREIAATISAIREPEQILRQVIEATKRLLGATGVLIDLVGLPEADPFWGSRAAPLEAANVELLKVAQLDPDAGVSGLAIRSGSVEWTSDYLGDGRFRHTPERDEYVRTLGLRSVMAAPLLAGERAVGAITIYSDREAAWDEAHAAVLEALAHQAAVTVTNARLLEELEASESALGRRVDAERTLREIAVRLTRLQDPRAVLQDTVTEAMRLLESDGARIDLYDDASRSLRWAYTAGEIMAERPEWAHERGIAHGEGVAGLALAERRTVRVDEYATDTQIRHAPGPDSFVASTGIRSVLSAPLVGEAGVLGTISVVARRPSAYDEEDEEVIAALATQASIAIQNARLIEQLEGSQEELARRAEAERSLREIGAGISAIRDADEVLQQTVEEACRLLRAEGAMIDLLEDEESLRSSYDAGIFREVDRGRTRTHVMRLGEGIVGRAVQDGRVIRTGDYLTDDFRHTPDADSLVTALRVRSVIAAPILGESGPVGAIEVHSRRPDAFDDLDAAVLGGLANQAAIAIQNARLIQELARSREEVRRRADAERTLREIAAEVSALHQPEAILQRTVEEAQRLLESEDARIDLLVGDRLVWTYSSSTSLITRWERAGASLGALEGISGAAVRERKAFVTGEYLADRRFIHVEEVDRSIEELDLHSAVAVPLLGEAGPLGALSVVTKRVDAYDDAAVEILQALANQAAIAIQNAQLIEELEQSREALAKRAERERSLREMAARIAELRDPADLLERVVEESRRLLGSDGAHLTRMSEERTHVTPVVVAGELDDVTEEWLLTQEFPLMGGINGLAAGLGEPVWTRDYLDDGRIPHEPTDLDTAQRLGLRGMAAVPLRAPEGEVIGTLAVSYRTPRTFDEEEIAVLQGLADHAAIALTNSRLYERVTGSEARYRHLVQNSPDVVWSIDENVRFSFVSDTCERLTGWRPEELLGRHFGSLVHESSREIAELDWSAAMTGPTQELRGRVNLLHREGYPVVAEFIANATFGEDGRFAGANGSVRDMRELDRLERELRDSEARYRLLLQSSPDLIWAADAEGYYTFMSDRAEEVLGRPADQWVGHHFSEFIAPDDLPAAEIGYREILANPGAIQRIQFFVRHADGSLVPFEVHALARVDAEGALVGVTGVARDVGDRERLERGLRESEERFRQLVQASPDVIWRADGDGVFRFVADAAERLFGWPADQLVGKHFSFVLAEEEAEPAAANWARLAGSPDEVLRARYVLRRADGSTFPAEVSAIGITDDGRFVGGQGTVRDVSDRERLERELRDSEARYRFLVENSPDVIFAVDERGRFDYVSESVERTMGWRPEELVGRDLSVVLTEEGARAARILSAAQRRRPERERTARLEIRHRDGRVVPFELSTVGRVRDGRYVGIQGVGREISVRERLERELRESEARYRFLLQNSPDIIFSVDRDGTITYISETVERLTGWRPDELIGQHFEALVERSQGRDGGSNWARAASDPTLALISTNNLRFKNGRSVPFEISTIGIADAEGRFAGVHGSARDVSEREGLERHLRMQAAELAASEERAHLARELHDSVTQALFSMTLLTRTTELLVDRDPAAAKQNLAGLRDLQREALAEMRALIFELRPGNLEQDGLLHALRTHAAALQARIGLPMVVKSELTDRLPIEVEQVLYRIAQEALHNVVKHAAAHQVRLELDRLNGEVRLRITDDGKGFDPRAVPEGHLGLAGMRARAEKLGGRVEVRSRPGAGTTVEVALPDPGAAGGPAAGDTPNGGIVRDGVVPSDGTGAKPSSTALPGSPRGRRRPAE